MACDSPSSYDDCILKHMEGVKSDRGAFLIESSCGEKYPDIPIQLQKSRNLIRDEFTKVTGRAGLNYGNRYSGNLYNGNQEITVTQVRVRVTTNKDEVTAFKDYLVEVNIPPMTAVDFGFDIVLGDKGTNYSWGLFGGDGYEN